MLRVTLISASDLAGSDWGLEGKKSDPFVEFRVGKMARKSSYIKQQLNPEWKPQECFEFPVSDTLRDVLHVKVYDYDHFSKSDLLGTIVLPVSQFSTAANVPQRRRYHLDVPDEFASQKRQSRIELEICYLTDSYNGSVTLRLWENEVWTFPGGWASSNTVAYRRYSSYDDTTTHNKFEHAAPPVPPGREGDGWAYVLETNRGDDGWMYAFSFAGPYSSTRSIKSFVRRRLWENRCIACEEKNFTGP